MAHVLIVSNRLPVNVTKVDGKLHFSTSVGGLSNALSAYSNSRHNRWIGWPGIASDDLSEADKTKIRATLARKHCIPVFLTQKQIDDFYSGYSNSLLWPLLHTLPFKDENTAQHDRWYKAYRAVNQAYADTVFDNVQIKSTVWVQDYQLMLLPQLLRRQPEWDVSQHIGFFLHVPFPKQRQYAKIPEAKRLLKGLLGADLIGFHTPEYVKNFMDTSQQAGISQLSGEQLVIGGRSIRVTHFPIGIDYQKFADAKAQPAVKQAARELRQKYKGLKIIASVDRLDISKGFVERLQAYREFLVQNPKLRGKVVFVLVGAPSRTDVEAYQKLAKQVMSLAVKINDDFSTQKWKPLDYISHAIPFEEVTALLSIADVAFVTPLRDGMNLVAKEFVASNNTGVLVLSETAGAAEELRDALLVNPRKLTSSVDALQQALTMPKRELQYRLKTMRDQIAGNTAQDWAKTFMHTLQQPLTPLTETTAGLRTATLKGSTLQRFKNNYDQAQKRLLLLDYDGTLREFEKRPADAKPSPKLMQLLEKLSSNPANCVTIISGRTSHDLDDWFGHLPINLVAEHGAMTKSGKAKRWQTAQKSAADWRQQVEPILRDYAELTPNATVEVKPHSIVWHYRQSPAYYAQKYGVVLRKALRPTLKRNNLALYQGNKILEIKDPTITKGTAVRNLVDGSYDFIMIIGDDYTDEDMFAELPTAQTIKVGTGRTAARYRLADPKAVTDLLRELA